jgi:hypothetical protein
MMDDRGRYQRPKSTQNDCPWCDGKKIVWDTARKRRCRCDACNGTGEATGDDRVTDNAKR